MNKDNVISFGNRELFEDPLTDLIRTGARQGVPGKPAETTGTDRLAATLTGNIKNPPGMFTSLEAECDALEYSW